ncbi:MAG: indolepyruvate ferredoxin oxidoreductase [Miltoncostaeaceae bacterium]|nr:indolepyruvate ferredoxin oxidoreductase [Miltoncostaeaceae bacterium]
MATVAAGAAIVEEDGPVLERGCGRAVLTGNELIVKGALEAGISLITGYPGSPVAEVFPICEAHAQHLRQLGVEAILANNEAQSAAMINGARQVPGSRSMTVFKSVGAYVALDALAIANAARPGRGAGAIVVVGDDPACSSTQVGADSRLTLAAGRIPVLEPATPQEMKDFVGTALELSAEAELILAVMVTTEQADGSGAVDLLPNLPPRVGPRARVALDTAGVRVADAVSLPPQASALEADVLLRRLPALHAAVAARGLDREERPRRDPLDGIGFVVAGASYPLLREALDRLGLDGRVPLLRLALTWPLDPDTVARFAATVGEVVVVEERAGHLEDQVRRALEGSGTRVWGKRFPEGIGFPEAGGLDPDLVRAALERLILQRPAAFPAEVVARATADAARRAAPAAPALKVLQRTPTYCAGCPHRGTSSPLIEIRRRLGDADYMRRVHGRAPVDLIAHGGIGCYSMSFLPPFEEMHDLSAMGLGGATGAGSAPLVTNRHYVLVGDGTFFHGEMSTMANAIKQRQDILYIVLDNKNTAMTGHQGTPASETDLMGRPQAPIEIERIVAAMRPAFLARSNPDDRDAHMALLERAFLMDGTRVVIADKECAITSGRRRRAERAAIVRERGYLPEITRYNVVEEACENCRECTRSTACPGLAIVDTPLGQKVGIDGDVCVDDGYCAAIKACPSFERVTIRRRRAPQRPVAPSAAAALRPPRIQAPAIFRARVAGVGGMGIGVVARILTEAASRRFEAVDGYQKKGLAQRGGSVHADLVAHDGRLPRAGLVAPGEADLVIGLDLLEGLRALELADPARTFAVIDTSLRPTVAQLMANRPLPADALERARERVADLLAADFSGACQRELGERLYGNVAMLGAAWQRGWLPMDAEALEAAVRTVAGGRAAANLRALELGRRLAVAPQAAPDEEGVEALLDREEGWIRSRRERRAFRAGVERARAAGWGEEALRALAPRLPEILVWGGPRYADRYLGALERVAAAVPALLPHAIHNLHRAMAIKDEVFVAHLLTSERKYARDRERFGIDPARGDRLSYVHLNRPAFDLLGRHVEFDMRTRDWMLRMVRRARVLRRLMPAWHRRERAFRDWYEQEALGAVCDGRLAGAAAEEALRLPEQVTGYRAVRYPKEDAAYARFRDLIQHTTDTDSEDRT